MKQPSEISVHHDAAQNCYEARVQNRRCVTEYVMADGRMIFTHTYVPPELRGQGIAEQIVRFALSDARVRGFQVTAACSYVARFIERNPEFKALAK